MTETIEANLLAMPLAQTNGAKPALPDNRPRA
jgi:hypothetical protein